MANVDAPLENPSDSAPKVPLAQPRPQRLLNQLVEQTPIIAAVAVTILFCLIIGSLFFPYLFGYQTESSLLRELANLDQARGLITFLVAVTTVGIALILTVFIVVTNDTGAKDKFIQGKEVLTGLIGVLGTIVGFYFGSVGSQQPASAGSTLKLSKFVVEPASAKVGSKFKVISQATGAKLPLQYTISFKADVPIAEKSGVSAKDEFTEEFFVPEKSIAGAAIEVLVSVKDKSGTLADSKLLPAQSVKVLPQ